MRDKQETGWYCGGMEPSDHPQPPTFADVQDDRGVDVFVMREVAQMTQEQRLRSQENIASLVLQMRATARPINPDGTMSSRLVTSSRSSERGTACR